MLKRAEPPGGHDTFVSEGAAENLYRESALEEAMLELVATHGEAWLGTFRDALLSKMRGHIVGGDEAFESAPDNEKLELLAKRQQFISEGEQAIDDSIAAVRHRLSVSHRD